MTKSKRALVLALATTILLTLGWYERAKAPDEVTLQIPEVIAAVTTATTTEKEIPKKPAPQKPSSQEAWLLKLILCESSGNPGAINPIDRDGTPSYGLLQFKPSTFELFSKAYGIEGELMDPEAQKAIVRRMMRDPSVKWENQFPACVRKLGRPPQP